MNKNIISFILKAITVTVILILTGCATVKPIQKNKVQWLFVLSAPHARIIKLNSKTAELVFNKSSLDRLIMFADRPNRIIKYISFAQFQQAWTKNKNSFIQDPPNAVFATHKLHPLIVTVTKCALKHKQVCLTIKYLYGPINLPQHVDRFMMMIDSSHWEGCECGLIGKIVPWESC